MTGERDIWSPDELRRLLQLSSQEWKDCCGGDVERLAVKWLTGEPHL